MDDPIWHEDAANTPPAPPRPRRRWLAVLSLAALLVAGYGLVATYLSRQDYGTFAFWRVPSRIDYCGRRYYSAGIASGIPSTFIRQVDPSARPRWQTVGHTFSLRPIQAPVSQHWRFSSVCTMELYVPVGGARYETYELSGGP